MNKEIFIKCLNSLHTDKNIEDIDWFDERNSMYFFTFKYHNEHGMGMFSNVHSLNKSTYEQFEALENLKDTKRKIENINKI